MFRDERLRESGKTVFSFGRDFSIILSIYALDYERADMLSVIVPAFNEEAMIAAAASRISAVLDAADIQFELIFVDDGSRDATWEKILAAAAENPRVRGLHFSRNFGKEPAMFAGLEAVRGDCAVVLDCDLQHPPEKIPEMYALWQQGYEVVEGKKSSRGKESLAHKASAGLFYKMISRSTGFDMADASDFKLMDRKVVDALNGLKERGVFFRALSFWVGFRSTTVEYEVQERTAGESKWSLGKLIKYAITNVASFTSAPLHIVTVLGVIMLLASIVLGIVSLVQKIAGVALGGFTTVILLELFIGSLLMISIGIIGYYVARIYEEVKGRPRYIVSATCGTEAQDEEILRR